MNALYLMIIMALFVFVSRGDGALTDIAAGGSSVQVSETKNAKSLVIRHFWRSDELRPEAKQFTHKNMVELEKVDHARLLARFQYQQTDMELTIFSKRKAVTPSDEDGDSPKSAEKSRKGSYCRSDGILRVKLLAIGGKAAGSIKSEIKFKYLEAKVNGKRPLVLVLPPIVGSTLVDRDVGALFAQGGMDVIILEMEDMFPAKKTLHEMNAISVQTVIMLRMLIQAILGDPVRQIDRDKVCVFGMSFGAVLAATLVGMDDNVKYAYLIGGGGNLADILTYSNQRRLVNFRNYNISSNGNFRNLKKNEQLNRLFAEMRLIAEADPVYFAKKAASKKIHMVMSTNDDIIPFRDQLELWNAFGNPGYELSRLSHIGTVIRWYIRYRNDALKFFSK